MQVLGQELRAAAATSATTRRQPALAHPLDAELPLELLDPPRRDAASQLNVLEALQYE